eukprot:CAMPEP_0176466668 /NCGR_PEP_ID=MMETSP0127-20121128/38030_1 /TAXON_ID=938130 /ORGANISM="Platyophrya macrostoma, Strain WH" /LENGTH=166 /DNA_ID=CAMNT_0017859881 /DNA_START=164 /DNA_END=664 /DNA_ORIENTATION=-
MTTLKMNNTKIRNEIKRMVDKKEPRQNIKIVAQNLVKNNAYIQKYSRLDAQLADVEFKIQSIATTDAMVNVLKGMTNILKLNEKNMNIKDIQKSMAEFMKQQEKQELMNEQINDIMADDDVDVDNDTEVDKIIDEIASGDKQKTANVGVNQDNDLDEMEKQLGQMK